MPLKRSTGDLRTVDGTIHFPMEDTATGRRVICQVGIYVLKVLGGADDVNPRRHYDRRGFSATRYPGHMQVFLDFRERIEKLASSRYDDGYRRPSIGGDDAELISPRRE